ncbi:hypothetical protein LCGC14_0246140 [marine sediment metagenome]|uniref:Uncharacterized protein n=1 Tax=marine sediment metagenome TaxID=412755 RepID=A0A0F9XAN1_9ZZZZ
MKNSTKYKIVQWVERLIGYKPDPIIIQDKERREIQVIKYSFSLHEYNLLGFNLTKKMTVGIVEELIKNNELLVITTRKHSEDTVVATALLFCIKPIKQWKESD